MAKKKKKKKDDEAETPQATDADEVTEETAEETDDAEKPAEETDEAADDDAEKPAEETDEAADDDAEKPAEGDEESDGEAGLTLGQEAADDEEPREPKQPKLIRGKIDKHGIAIGTGRRKTAVARVRIRDGDGQMAINGRTLDDYFAIERDRLLVEAPLRDTETHGKVDVWVRVHGGGMTGQAGAIVLGIARALQAKNPNLHEKLADGGFLTRDDRMVERKKYGYKKARKSFQFSKR